jgi:hypothetical protein
MSIVVAVTKENRTVMAADTMGFYGSQRVPVDNSRAFKIRRVGPILLAMTGWSVYDNIIDDMLAKQPDVSLGSTQEIFNFFMNLWAELHERYPFVNDQAASKDSPSPTSRSTTPSARGATMPSAASTRSTTPTWMRRPWPAAPSRRRSTSIATAAGRSTSSK